MNKHHPLGELIQSAQDKNGWSVRDLQRRAEEYGFEMKHSNFSRLKLHEVVTVKGDVIRMLAKVLALPESMVARAALASMGIDLSATDSTVDEAVRTSTEFSERDRNIIQAVVDVMRSDTGSRNSGTNNAKQSGPEPLPINPRTGRHFRRGSGDYHRYLDALDQDDRGQRRDPGAGQKSEQSEDVTSLATRRRADQIDVSHKGGGSRASDYEGNNIPLPDDYEQLAADSGHTRHVERERDWVQQGEESQETDD
ncbi:hypothetical protein [Arthrobacter sp. MP_2.3]|uniref:hypothetical protein n=1 Tax=Arthrobacter sp. MP_2.3 TaxID=3349633 RepID=UPI0038D45CCC